VRRVETFLYSRRNIVGTLLALGGLALHFVGIVAGPLWLPITVGLYLIGVLVVPGERGLELRIGSAQDASEVRDGLDRLLRALRGKVAPDLYAKVQAIQASILRTLDMEATPGDGADPNVYLIRQTALAYLPDAFSTYLRLPRAVAERRTIADGRTPHDVLLDQLDLMDGRLADVADDMARHDSDKLLANGRFLAEKFAVSSLSLDGVAASVAESAPASTAVVDAAAAASSTAPAVIASAGQASVPAPAPAPETVAERERVR
jgi:hypothetical protein